MFTVLGELTIKDVTREVELTLEIEGVGNSPYGKQVMGFTLTTEISREDYGMTWNVAVEGGGVLVGKTVEDRDRGRSRPPGLGDRCLPGRSALGPATVGWRRTSPHPSTSTLDDRGQG